MPARVPRWSPFASSPRAVCPSPTRVTVAWTVWAAERAKVRSSGSQVPGAGAWQDAGATSRAGPWPSPCRSGARAWQVACP